MAKNEKVINKPNAKGFNKGSNPKKFGPTDDPKAPSSENNKIGGTSEPQEKSNKPGVADAVLDYPDKNNAGINAVSRPNKKAREVDNSVLDFIGDDSDTKVQIADIPVGGHLMPNNIR